jgi:hypothetical protein
MNAKYLAILLVIFGVLFTLAQCGRLTVRSDDDDDDDNDDNNGGGVIDGDDDDDDADLRGRKELTRFTLL